MGSTVGQSYTNYQEYCHNLVSQTADTFKYTTDDAIVLSIFIKNINAYDGVSFAQQFLYSLA